MASIGSHELSWVVSETLIAYGLLPPVSLISSKNFQEHKLEGKGGISFPVLKGKTRSTEMFVLKAGLED